jgi:hypothetical protein
MGTSTACPGSPKWGNVKAASTRTAGKEGIDSDSSGSIIGSFVDQLRDGKDDGIGIVPANFGVNLQSVKDRLSELLGKFPKSPVAPHPSNSGSSSKGSEMQTSGGSKSRGGNLRKGGSGRSGSYGGKSIRSISGRGIRPTAQRVASFLSAVSKVGLVEALKEAGLVDLAGASPDQIALALADVLCGPNSLIVDAELRDATSSLLEELSPDVQSLDAMENSLTQASYNLEGVLSKLFENYIMERFKTTLSEHLSKFGYNTADKIAKEARELVSTEFQLLKADSVDLTSVEWTGKEGSVIIETILEKTIAVYLS